MREPAINEEGWGFYGKEPPCEHLLALRDVIVQHGLSVEGEMEEDGWVKVACRKCRRTYETLLYVREKD